MERKKIELLAPAGDMERLQMAAGLWGRRGLSGRYYFRHALLCRQLYAGSS